MLTALTFGEALLGLVALFSLFGHLLLLGQRWLVVHGAAQG